MAAEDKSSSVVLWSRPSTSLPPPQPTSAAKTSLARWNACTVMLAPTTPADVRLCEEEPTLLVLWLLRTYLQKCKVNRTEGA